MKAVGDPSRVFQGKLRWGTYDDNDIMSKDAVKLITGCGTVFEMPGLILARYQVTFSEWTMCISAIV